MTSKLSDTLSLNDTELNVGFAQVSLVSFKIEAKKSTSHFVIKACVFLHNFVIENEPIIPKEPDVRHPMHRPGIV